MQAFHNSPAIKAACIERIHRGLPAVTDDAIEAYEPSLGVPAILPHIRDAIASQLPAQAAPFYPLRFAQAIPVGADLSVVANAFFHWLLMDPAFGVVKLSRHQVLSHVERAAGLHRRCVRGEYPSEMEWFDAYEAGEAYRVRLQFDPYRAISAQTVAVLGCRAMFEPRFASPAVRTAMEARRYMGAPWELVPDRFIEMLSSSGEPGALAASLHSNAAAGVASLPLVP